MCKRTSCLFLTFVILISFFSIATAQEPVEPPPEPPDIIAPPTEPADPEVIMATVQNLHDAFNAHDMELWKTYVTDDIVVDAVPSPPPASGKEEAAAFFEAFIQGFPDLYGNLDSVLISGNIAVAQTTMTGTHLGEWAGVAPTGNEIQVIVLEVMEFEGDKEKRATFYWDAMSMMVQLGLMPAPELDPALLVPSFTLPDPEPTGLAPLEAYAEQTARWNSADLSHWSKMIHQDADILVSSLGIPMNRDAYIAFQELYLLGFPDREQENIHVVDLGDGWVLTEMVFTGTNDGPYLGIPATGLPITLRAGQVNRFDEDGILTYQYSYFDSLTILAQIGALEPEAPTEDELIALHQTHMAALDAHDVDQIMSFFTDDAIYDYVPLPAPMTTKEEIGAFFGNLFQAFPDYETTSEHLLVAGNIMVTEHTTAGTHQGEWSGIPATGNTVLGMHMDIFEFEGEKLKQATTYDNAASMLIQLGLMPASELPELVPSFQLPAPEPPGLPPLEAAENGMAVWNTHDLVSYAKLFHPDAEILIAPFGFPMDVSAFIASQELYFLAYSDLQEETVRIVDMGDGWVLAEIVFVGTNDGPYFGVPATGNSMEVRGAWIGHYDEDGLATKMNVYWDHLTTLTQLGLFPPPSETEANKAIANRIFDEIWNQGNLDVADEIFAADFTRDDPGNPDLTGTVGPDGFKQLVSMYRAAFPDTNWVVDDVIAEGDLVATRWTSTGTQTGELMGMPATGLPGTVTGISILRIADGKVVEEWVDWDSIGLMEQLGFAPTTRQGYSWSDPSEVTGAPGDLETNKAIVTQHVEAWNQHNTDMLDDIMIADSVHHDPVMYPGEPDLETYKQVVGMYFFAFPDIHCDIDIRLAEGDKVVMRGRASGTHQGELMGIPATGRRVSWTWTTVSRLADGKIVDTWWQYDVMGLMQQLTVTQEEINKAIANRIFDEIWNQGDLDVADEIFAPGAIRNDSGNPSASGAVGPEGFKQLVAAYRAAFPDIHFTHNDLIAEGDLVAGRWTSTGTHSGELMGIPPTGKVVTGTGISISRFVDGKFVQGWDDWDTLGMFQQLGLIPPDRTEFTWLDPLEVTGDPGEPEANKAIIQRIYDEIWNAGNLDLADELIATGFVGDYVPDPPTLGPEGFKQLVAITLSAFPDMHWTIEDQLAEGNKVVTRWTFRGTHTGDYLGIPPTGKVITVTGMSFDCILDGKLVQAWSSRDALGALQKLGVIPSTEPKDYSNVFFMALSPGLNMISVPLEPPVPFTARSLAEHISATTVIEYDEVLGKFVGFTPAAPDDGFPINGGEGYIVNVPAGGMFAFTGAAWTQPPMAAPPAQTSTAWAFVVSGSVLDGEGMSAGDGGYTVTVKNLRTGAVTDETVGESGYFAAAYADLSRKAVVEAGDRVEVAVVDSSGKVVSGPFVHDITLDGIRDAVVRVQLRLGDIIPEKSALLQNYPNPFNPETWIPFHLKGEASVSIRIFSLSGQLIRTLELGHRDAGVYVSSSKAAYWDGKNEAGEDVSSGIYFYSIAAGDFSATKKMIMRK